MFWVRISSWNIIIVFTVSPAYCIGAFEAADKFFLRIFRGLTNLYFRILRPLTNLFFKVFEATDKHVLRHLKKRLIDLFWGFQGGLQSFIKEFEGTDKPVWGFWWGLQNFEKKDFEVTYKPFLTIFRQLANIFWGFLDRLRTFILRILRRLTNHFRQFWRGW